MPYEKLKISSTPTFSNFRYENCYFLYVYNSINFTKLKAEEMLKEIGLKSKLKTAIIEWISKVEAIINDLKEIKKSVNITII